MARKSSSSSERWSGSSTVGEDGPDPGRPSATVGVDFGTSTTVVAVRDGSGDPGILPIGATTAEMPSVAGYSPRGRLLTGERADRLPAARTIRSVKRQISARKDTVWVRRGDERVEVGVEEVVGTLLRETGERAARHGVDLDAVGTLRLGCPAQWDAAQRRTLRTIAAGAGLGNASPELVDEPVAAGVGWVAAREAAGRPVEGRVLVFDYGGGTLDVAVLDVRDVDGRTAVSVLSAVGLHRAGDALDAAIVADLADDWRRAGADLAAAPRPETAQALAERAARQAKIRLSTVEAVPVRVGDDDWWLPEVVYTRARLEERFGPQLDEAMRVVDAAVRAADLRESESAAPGGIGAVLLAGGLSQVPAVRRRFAETFGDAEVTTDPAVTSPAYSVAHGLASSPDEHGLTLHRPGFDVVLEWVDAAGASHRHTLYRAQTPLYEWQQVMAGHRRLGFEATTRDVPVRAEGPAAVRLVGLDGSDVPLRVGGQDRESLPVTVTSQRPMEMSLSLDGRLRLQGSDGRRQVLRVGRWPAFRRGAPPVLEMEMLSADLDHVPAERSAAAGG
ncbi:MAG: Hsp70 family protein [Kineosporiaceae bacterium]